MFECERIEITCYNAECWYKTDFGMGRKKQLPIIFEGNKNIRKQKLYWLYTCFSINHLVCSLSFDLLWMLWPHTNTELSIHFIKTILYWISSEQHEFQPQLREHLDWKIEISSSFSRWFGQLLSFSISFSLTLSVCLSFDLIILFSYNGIIFRWNSYDQNKSTLHNNCPVCKTTTEKREEKKQIAAERTIDKLTIRLPVQTNCLVSLCIFLPFARNSYVVYTICASFFFASCFYRFLFSNFHLVHI